MLFLFIPSLLIIAIYNSTFGIKAQLYSIIKMAATALEETSITYEELAEIEQAFEDVETEISEYLFFCVHWRAKNSANVFLYSGVP